MANSSSAEAVKASPVRRLVGEILPIPEDEGNELFAGYCDTLQQLAGRDGGGSILLAQVQRMYDAEQQRRISIDTRAGSIIGAIGISTLFVSLIGVDVQSSAPAAFLIAFAIALLYFAWAAYLALRVQGTRETHKLDPDDLLEAQSTSDPQHKQAIILLGYVIKDYKVTNRRANILYKAQKSLRNAIIALTLGGGGLVLG